MPKRVHRQTILEIFKPLKSPLFDDLLVIILEMANLIVLGGKCSIFTIFFPRLIKRRHESVDEGSDETLP